MELFQIPQRIETCQGTVFSEKEALRILLKRFLFPCRFCDMVWVFRRTLAELCLIFNHMIDIIHAIYGWQLNIFNQNHLAPDILGLYVSLRIR